MKKDSIYASNFKVATIIGCSNPDYWYVGMEGKKIRIRELNWPSAYVEAENGFCTLKIDLSYNGNPKQSN